MKKEELLNELYKLERFEVSVGLLDFMSKTAVKLNHVLALVDQLDQPTKVEPLVVPKHLGEWLAERHLGCQGSLFSIIGGLEDMWVGSHFEDFISDNKKELIEVILGTRPYKVEEEKLYYVLNKQGETLLLSTGGKVSMSVGYTLRESNKEIYQLTEKQIKDYDERYLPFMVPINEVSE